MHLDTAHFAVPMNSAQGARIGKKKKKSSQKCIYVKTQTQSKQIFKVARIFFVMHVTIVLGFKLAKFQENVITL